MLHRRPRTAHPAPARQGVRPSPARLLAALSACAMFAPLASAQGACASDGVPPPPALYERFISAECEACWREGPRHVPSPPALVLDWIVPGERGDEAPLSAAATPDARERLRQLGRPIPLGTDTHVAAPAPASPRSPGLRLAHGLPVNDYVGVTLALRPRAGMPAGAYRYTVVLAEHIPAGTEQTPVERFVVRGMLQGPWDVRGTARAASPVREIRPMRIPEGVQAERLFVAGWLKDPQGRIVTAARSRCAPEP
ncbi:hypothetical protein AX018_105927 [Paracidovorax anthurii]|uniref:Lipoprotein n=2 Tax=Paracidovorax anthurii TaxID=78229 RepID=A0A328YRD7_9BURK|nr:hypothetical protein [Paracidovorax anthurii]RAR75954.1 hypothetical protein AX018_105927 [Paracidovorax anthurii]